MRCPCVLLVWTLCAASCALCAADVGDFAPCLNFFYKDWPPKGLSGTPICQRYSNRFHFASLYSRQRRAPWLSAYLYSVPSGKRPTTFWKFEPQLAYQGANGNMKPFPPGPLDQNVVESQAVEPDYINSSYSRGHLNPCLHHQSRERRLATFTLTNAVPQKMGSNQGPWELLEQTVNKSLSACCLGDAYVVTGIIPYEKDDRWLNNHRVAVPEYLWSAYCCPNYNQSLPNCVRDTFPTYAAIGRNDPNSGEDIVPINRLVKKPFLGYDVLRMSLAALEGHLGNRFNTTISVFYERCGKSDRS